MHDSVLFYSASERLDWLYEPSIAEAAANDKYLLGAPVTLDAIGGKSDTQVSFSLYTHTLSLSFSSLFVLIYSVL